MTVEELNREEYEELRERYFYDLYYGDEADELQDEYDKIIGILPDYSEQIPEEAMIMQYSGVNFVEEDFSCNYA